MKTLRTYRVLRLAATFVLTLGITLPIIQMACAMGGHAMEAISNGADHDHQSRSADSNCERPPACCSETEPVPLPESCEQCLQEVLIMNRTPVLTPVNELDPVLAVAFIDPIFTGPTISDLVAGRISVDSSPPLPASSIQVLYSTFLL